MQPQHRATTRTATGLSVLLVGLCLVVFGRTLGFDFVDYDDGGYVQRNPEVLAGWTRDGLRWALGTPHMGLWAPLTWISYMTEVELLGATPAVFHGTNLVLHSLNTVLLFLFVRSASGATWRSALVAALFAVHPLHVEPVAWIASRKDLLSTAFGWLALLAYLAHARRAGTPSGILAYVAAGLCLALGLLAKPMLVTFPLLFLGIDAWLGRARRAAPRDTYRAWAALALSKTPLFAIAAAAAVAAYWAQSSAGTLANAEALPWRLRLANAVVSCVGYLEKTVWPEGLCVLYPHPYIAGAGGTPPSPGWIAAAALLLIAVSAWTLRRRTALWMRLGWAWYLVTLLPVLGLVQLGRQAMADRFSYVPLVGIFLIVAFGAGALAERRPRLRTPLAVACGLWVALLAGLARVQTEHWRDPLALYGRALAVEPDNATMHYNLGTVLVTRGELEPAMERFERALALQPAYGRAHYNLALLRHGAGELPVAIEHYRAAIGLLDGEQRERARAGLSRATIEWAAAQR